MDSHAEILMSSKELGCRRTNKQSQRYLDCVLKQLDQEKQMVQKDWDHRIKTLVTQKKKVMPSNWDPHSKRRPKSAWGTEGTQKFNVISRPGSLAQPGTSTINIPDHWKHFASYRITPSGERIQIPLPQNNGKASTRPNTRVSSATKRYNKFRRVQSAPVRRTADTSSCLITQQSKTNPEVEQDNIITDDFKNKSDAHYEHKTSVVKNRPPRVMRCRPVSATTSMNRNKTKNTLPIPITKCSSHLNSSSTLDSVGSFTLLRQVIDLV